MACGCRKNEKNDETDGTRAVEEAKVARVHAKTLPTEPCLYCAGKHLAEAWECWHEYMYRSEDLRHIQGALRAFVLHTYQRWAPLARLARDCATRLQRADFDGFEAGLKGLCAMYDETFAKEEPEVQARLDAAGAVCDVVIPLGNGSRRNNQELRWCLRSIAENAIGVGRVILATDMEPDWISGEVEICRSVDAHTDNKDLNLIEKTCFAIREFGVSDMTWMADDNVILQPTRLSTLPVIANSRTRKDYEGGSRWRQRVLSTFDWAESRGVHLDHSLESHAPQTFLKCSELPRLTIGLEQPVTIMTCFHVLLGTWNGNMWGREWQSAMKDTYEHTTGAFKPPTKMFCGYNDAGLEDGLDRWLDARFPSKCRYER